MLLYQNRVKELTEIFNEMFLSDTPGWKTLKGLPKAPEETRQLHWRQWDIKDLEEKRNVWKQCADHWTKLFCKVLGEIKTGKLPDKTRKWFYDHQEEDRRRKATEEINSGTPARKKAEEIAELRDKTRRRALAKLTEEEKEILGL